MNSSTAMAVLGFIFCAVLGGMAVDSFAYHHIMDAAVWTGVTIGSFGCSCMLGVEGMFVRFVRNNQPVKERS